MITRSSTEIERSGNHDHAQNHTQVEQRILAVANITRNLFEELREMGEITHFNDRRKIYYIGGLHQGKPSGYGIMHYRNGDIYVGWRSRGFREGYGALYCVNGDYLEGKWRHGKFSTGIKLYSNRDLEGIYDELPVKRISLRQGLLSTQIRRIIREAMHSIRFGYHNVIQIIEMIYNLRNLIGQ